jgi:hypothetical protein
MNISNSDITSSIHLALAPVFLLTAVAALITAINTRIARAVDRMRYLHNELNNDSKHPIPLRQHYLKEFEETRTRGRMCVAATFFDVLSGVLISITVLELFFFDAATVNQKLSVYVFITFVAAIVCFMTALIIVLTEVMFSYSSAIWNLPFETGDVIEDTSKEH